MSFFKGVCNDAHLDNFGTFRSNTADTHVKLSIENVVRISVLRQRNIRQSDDYQ